MNTEDLKQKCLEAKALSDNATPGPWFNELDSVAICKYSVRAIPYIENHQDYNSTARVRILTGWNENWNPESNLEFIAASRELVPLLADAVLKLLEKINKIKKLVNLQAEDEGLWCKAIYVSEAYIQQGLRKLHAEIEEKSSEEIAIEILKECGE